MNRFIVLYQAPSNLIEKYNEFIIKIVNTYFLKVYFEIMLTWVVRIVCKGVS